MQLIAVHAYNRSDLKLPLELFFQVLVAAFRLVDVCDQRFFVLQCVHADWIKVNKKRLRFHVIFDDFSAVFVARNRLDILALKAKNRLVVILRRSGVPQENHRVPFFHCAAGEHFSNRKRNSLF
ncbi:MAG: hypothetical protein IK094_08060, partial [Treponema sp.]|nr:hypothetical protein [Treponema sp.]